MSSRVSGDRVTYATARAHRAVTSFRPTSTMRLAPVSSKCDNCDIAVIAANIIFPRGYSTIVLPAGGDNPHSSRARTLYRQVAQTRRRQGKDAVTTGIISSEFS